MYYFLSSNDSTDVFESNKWEDFSVNISPSIHLNKEDGWRVGLLQLDIDTNNNREFESENMSKYIYIYCDLIFSNNSIGNLKSVINYISIDPRKKKQDIHTSFATPYYFSLNRENINSIRIYLKDEHGNSPTLSGYSSRCALHITQ